MNPYVRTAVQLFVPNSFLTRLAMALILLGANPASAGNTSAFWLDDSLVDPSTGWRDVMQIGPSQLTARTDFLPLTGGTFWHIMAADVVADTPLLIDFQNSSVVGLFSHFIVDAHGKLIATYNGGIQSSEVNRYFLRHARALSVPPGHYQIITRMTSPFLVTQLKPMLYLEGPYIESMKLANGLTLTALGIFLAVGLIYLTLSMVRHQMVDFFFSIFIFGNLFYNATALNILSDIFSWPIFYSMSLAVMGSNLAYMGFVMCLLRVAPRRTPRLYKIALFAIALLALFWLLLPFLPHYSLLFAINGAVVFSLYGLIAGIVVARKDRKDRKDRKTAQYYLMAHSIFVFIAFFAPLYIVLIMEFPPRNTLQIDQLGMFATAVEVILLTLVLAHRLNRISRDKSARLLVAQESLFAANQALRSRERFLANISHELRTPLNAIQGSVELLDEQIDKPKDLESLAVIEHASSFLLFLINDILDLAKLSDNKLKIDNRPFDVRELARQISRIYGNGADTRLEISIAPDTPEWIIGDNQRIEQVIANLLTNAFKFSPQGDVKLEISIQSRAQLVQVSVTDNGIGMDPESVKGIFNAFSQAESSTARVYGGTGLGLTISRNLVELMMGHIGVDSELGQGSHVWFTFPLVIAPAPVEQGATQTDQADLTGLKVVVVDDNAVNLKIVCGLLKHLDIEPFNRAQAALDYIGQHSIDVVIMDVQMPEMDGLTATRVLRENGYEKPIIAFTANSGEQDREDCFEAGVNDILVKPIKRQNLIDMLAKWSVAR